MQRELALPNGSSVGWCRAGQFNDAEKCKLVYKGGGQTCGCLSSVGVS